MTGNNQSSAEDFYHKLEDLQQQQQKTIYMIKDTNARIDVIEQEIIAPVKEIVKILTDIQASIRVIGFIGKTLKNAITTFTLIFAPILFFWEYFKGIFKSFIGFLSNVF